MGNQNPTYEVIAVAGNGELIWMAWDGVQWTMTSTFQTAVEFIIVNFGDTGHRLIPLNHCAYLVSGDTMVVNL